MAKKQDNVEQIVETAISLFSEHGYANTTFQMIADSIGGAQTAPLYHFRSKEGLFEACIKRCLESKKAVITEAIDIKDNAYDQLKKYYIANINWCNIHRSRAKLILLLGYFASTSDRFVDLYVDYTLASRKDIEGYLLAGQREKLFYFTGLSQVVAQSIQDSILGFSYNYIAGRARLIKTREIENYVDVFLKNVVKFQNG